VASGQRGSPKAIKQLPLDLPPDFVLMLDAFCDAAYGAPRAKVIREAVAAFVSRELQDNPGLKRRFDEAEQRLRKERFTVVPPTPITPKATTDG
jgi:hypothetical protein